MPKSNDFYDRFVRSVNDSEQYELSGESEYSRDRSDPYQMVDYMIDRGVDFRGKGPVGFFFSDERVRENVCEILTRDPLIDASEIEVEVRDGCVLLRGKVNSRRTKRLAELSIENLPGVRDIMNLLSFTK